MKHPLLLPGAILLLLSPACFSREEKISIRPDGSTRVTLRVEGDEEDIRTGDLLPDHLGWELLKEETPADRGRGGIVLEWGADFAAVADIPGTFARPDDPHAAAYLRWETRLETERQPGRTLYRFTRRYHGRRAGKFEELQEMMVPADLLERWNEHKENPLDSEEREKLLTGLAEYEAAATLLRVRDALGGAVEAGVVTLDARHAVLERLESFLEDELSSDFVRTFLGLPDERQEEEILQFRRAVRGELIRLLPRDQADGFLFFLDAEELAFEVTEDLADERFSVAVDLPGTVIASNALDLGEDAVSWEFDGKEIQEGDLVLSAVSVLE